ncbi:unnamed protein product, partial [Oppiella nova]
FRVRWPSLPSLSGTGTATSRPLDWNEEFDGDELDDNNWLIINNKSRDLFKYQISYNTDDPKNIRLVSGALAITAIPERHRNRNFTSATILSNKFFSYGRIDTRIAIPGGQALKSAIFLLPYDDSILVNPSIDFISTVNFENLIYSSVLVNGSYSPMWYLPKTKLDTFNTFTIDYQRIGLIVDETLSGGHRETIDMKAREWSPENIQIQNGNLFLIAVRRHLYSKNYTTAQITSKYLFTYGKFEIKASLPRGCPLMSHILLISNNGFINIMGDMQTGYSKHG